MLIKVVLDSNPLNSDEEEEAVRILTNPLVVRLLSNLYYDTLESSRGSLLRKGREGAIERATTVGRLDTLTELLTYSAKF